MSEEKTKRDAKVALTEEEQLYEDAIRRFKAAGIVLDKANKTLQDSVDKYGGDHDKCRALKDDVTEANKLFMDANLVLKDARVAAGKMMSLFASKNQGTYGKEWTYLLRYTQWTLSPELWSLIQSSYQILVSSQTQRG